MKETGENDTKTLFKGSPNSQEWIAYSSIPKIKR